MADTTIGTSVAIATPDLEIIEGQITTTSTQVAAHFNKRHSDVLRAIRNLTSEVDADFYQRNFASVMVEFTNGKGGTQQAPAYRITRDGFTLLAMGFTGKEAMQWKLAYLAAFNKMEQELLARTTRPANPALDYDRISPAQAQDLKELVHAIADAKVQGFGETWARLHRKFRVNSYLELPAARFDEARDYLLGKLPEQDRAGTVNELVAEWVRKIEEPNGYPAFLFLPLVEAVQRKTARTTGMLPEAQAREITVRLERLCRLFHPFSDQAGDVIGVLRALRGLHPNSSAHTPGYLQLLPRL